MSQSLFHDLEAFGNNIAVCQLDAPPITYRQLLEIADTFGAMVGERALVFLVCRNDPESIAAYIGLMRAGAVVFPINRGAESQHLAPLIDAFRPSFIVGPADEDFGGVSIGKVGGYGVFATELDIDYPMHPDLALLLTTSGSTGSRSLVRLSHRNLQSNAHAIARYLGITEADRPITTMPMSYSYGLSIINSHLVKGAALILNEHSMVSPEFWKTVKTERATTFGGVPFIFDILKKLRFNKMALPDLRYLTQAGGGMDHKLAEWFVGVCAEIGIDFFIMYGQTEAAPRISYVPPEKLPEKIGSIGKAIPGGELWLQDDDGNAIFQTHTTGELVYKGDNVSLGYANSRQQLSNGDENRGTLFTGDLATRDEDGYFHIVGRKKRFLKIFGHRINLDEIEKILAHDGFPCACAGTDGKLRLFFEHAVDDQAIKKLVFDKTGINATAQEIYCIDRIPRNDAGKILYPALDAMARG